jgi:hypothetical protein
MYPPSAPGFPPRSIYGVRLAAPARLPHFSGVAVIVVILPIKKSGARAVDDRQRVPVTGHVSGVGTR